jgi:zinc transporter ZupT
MSTPSHPNVVSIVGDNVGWGDIGCYGGLAPTPRIDALADQGLRFKNWMWIAIALVSGLASLAGYGLFQDSSPDTVAFVLAFAAGAILTMLADTMMPEAFQHGGKLVGILTTVGFAVAFAIHTLE